MEKIEACIKYKYMLCVDYNRIIQTFHPFKMAFHPSNNYITDALCGFDSTMCIMFAIVAYIWCFHRHIITTILKPIDDDVQIHWIKNDATGVYITGLNNLKMHEAELNIDSLV